MRQDRTKLCGLRPVPDEVDNDLAAHVFLEEPGSPPRLIGFSRGAVARDVALRELRARGGGRLDCRLRGKLVAEFVSEDEAFENLFQRGAVRQLFRVCFQAPRIRIPPEDAAIAGADDLLAGVDRPSFHFWTSTRKRLNRLVLYPHTPRLAPMSAIQPIQSALP